MATATAGHHPGRRFFEQLRVGDRFVTAGRTLTEADIHTYAGISGDFHAYHMDETVAQQGAFQGRICHGPLTLAVLSGLFRSRLGLFDGTGIATLGLTKVRFAKPVRPGDTVRGQLEVIDARLSRSRPNCGIVTLRMVGVDQDDDEVMSCEWTELVATSGAAE